ncbi:hypothetical protein GCM10009193_12840 [Shewanella aestuarii]|nr:hypothetical protein GCM10009193_12840 [Shewanella aestuarii]
MQSLEARHTGSASAGIINCGAAIKNNKTLRMYLSINDFITFNVFSAKFLIFNLLITSGLNREQVINIMLSLSLYRINT